MYDPDKYKNKASRSKPSQARGKERVRLILAAALELFKERGLDEITTNDIAERARVPIGSLYRYFPNKDSILVALTELYVDDISKIFIGISKHPLLKYLSWEEVLLLMVDGWANYSRLSGPFTFLYAEFGNPRLRQQTTGLWEKLTASFGVVLKKRCPTLTSRQIVICFGLCGTAAAMGVNQENADKVGPDLHHDAVRGIAAYMEQVCGALAGPDDDVLA